MRLATFRAARLRNKECLHGCVARVLDARDDGRTPAQRPPVRGLNSRSPATHRGLASTVPHAQGAVRTSTAGDGEAGAAEAIRIDGRHVALAVSSSSPPAAAVVARCERRAAERRRGTVRTPPPPAPTLYRRGGRTPGLAAHAKGELSRRSKCPLVSSSAFPVVGHLARRPRGMTQARRSVQALRRRRRRPTSGGFGTQSPSQRRTLRHRAGGLRKGLGADRFGMDGSMHPVAVKHAPFMARRAERDPDPAPPSPRGAGVGRSAASPWSTGGRPFRTLSPSPCSSRLARRVPDMGGGLRMTI